MDDDGGLSQRGIAAIHPAVLAHAGSSCMGWKDANAGLPELDVKSAGPGKQRHAATGGSGPSDRWHVDCFRFGETEETIT
jgi:hypothetical protein